MVRPAAHSFPHRGSPSTSHTRVRWQPYNTSLQSIPPRSSPLAFFVTPASSTSSLSPSPRPFSEPDRPRHVLHPLRESKLRDVQKSKFALSLVDQAVKSLCDIWPQQDIPPVFLTSGRPTVSLSGSEPLASTALSTCRNVHLPSPISPTTQHTPATSPVSSYSIQPLVSAQHLRCEAAPMKGFVHEVLRRSRTSGTVLQTALCYLEAVRSKVPDLVRKEKQGVSSSSRVAVDRISQSQAGVGYETGLGTPAPIDASSSDSLLATVRINSISDEADAAPSTGSGLNPDKVTMQKVKPDTGSLPPLPPLPSPLLCPRRTFLASLILASKFVQDRCYSNRAWAKLSGLPPREIGRCERALGEALEWRLWVGKLPAAQSASGRALNKSKSEGDIRFTGNSMVHIAGDMDSSAPLGSKVSTLRRSATVPPGNFHLEGSRVNGNDNTSPMAYSSSPSTPGLSYSPTPTESSLGDRTVHMNPFMDVSTPPPSQFATFTGAQNDKVLSTFSVPLNNVYAYTSSHDITLPALSQSTESQYYLPPGIVAPSSIWFNDDA